MKLLTLKQSGAVLAIGAVIMASFASVAIAEGNDSAGTDNKGTLQPVWCKLTGNGWKAQLSANGKGKNGPLTIDVKGYTKENEQIVAHDRSDKLDAACSEEYKERTPQLVTPVAPVSPVGPISPDSPTTTVTRVSATRAT